MYLDLILVDRLKVNQLQWAAPCCQDTNGTSLGPAAPSETNQGHTGNQEIHRKSIIFGIIVPWELLDLSGFLPCFFPPQQSAHPLPDQPIFSAKRPIRIQNPSMWRGFLIVILILSEGNGALGICLRETMGKPMGLHPCED